MDEDDETKTKTEEYSLFLLGANHFRRPSADLFLEAVLRFLHTCFSSHAWLLGPTRPNLNATVDRNWKD
jgi:hypothetical protein